MAVVHGFVGSWQDLLPAPFVEEAAAWLQEHVEEITRRGGTRHWQWGLAVLTWMMERCGVVELLRDQPTIAGELLAEARFTAAARRQAPFTAWERGQEHCSPGCRLPGGEVASAVTATRLGRTCLQAEAGTEEAIRRLLLEAARRVGPPAGDDVVMGGDNGGPLGDPPDNRIPAPEACRGGEAAAAHDRGAHGPSLDAPTTPGDGPRTAVLGTGGAVDPRLAAEPPLPPPSPPPPLFGGGGCEGAGGRGRAGGGPGGLGRCYWGAQLHGPTGSAQGRSPSGGDRVLPSEPGWRGWAARGPGGSAGGGRTIPQRHG